MYGGYWGQRPIEGLKKSFSQIPRQNTKETISKVSPLYFQHAQFHCAYFFDGTRCISDICKIGAFRRINFLTSKVTVVQNNIAMQT